MLKGLARVWFNSESFQTIPTFHSMRVRFHSESKNRILRTRNRPSLIKTYTIGNFVVGNLFRNIKGTDYKKLPTVDFRCHFNIMITFEVMPVDDDGTLSLLSVAGKPSCPVTFCG